MKATFIRLVLGIVILVLAAIACRQNEPGLEPKTPPNSPIPTKLDRPDDPPASPMKLPKLGSQGDGG